MEALDRWGKTLDGHQKKPALVNKIVHESKSVAITLLLNFQTRGPSVCGQIQ